MGEKNCYVVRLNAIVNDSSLDPLLEDGTSTFRLFTNPVSSEKYVYTRPLGAFEMKVLGTMPTLINPSGTPESIVDGYIYKVTEAMPVTWGGFKTDDAAMVDVRVNMKTEEVANLGFVYSADVDLSLIGDAYIIQLSNPNLVPQKYHRGASGTGITLAQLNLADKYNISALRANYNWGDGGNGFVTGTTSQIAAAAVTGLGELEYLELYGNKGITGDISELAVLPKLKYLYLAHCNTEGSIEDFVKAIINEGANDTDNIKIGGDIGLGVSWQGYNWFDAHWVKATSAYGNVLNNGEPKTISWTVFGSTATITIAPTNSEHSPLSPDSEDYTTTINLS